jgi:hypothetical protein
VSVSRAPKHAAVSGVCERPGVRQIGNADQVVARTVENAARKNVGGGGADTARTDSVIDTDLQIVPAGGERHIACAGFHVPRAVLEEKAAVDGDGGGIVDVFVETVNTCLITSSLVIQFGPSKIRP